MHSYIKFTYVYYHTLLYFKGVFMQTAILITLATSFIGLSSNQKHLMALGWLSCGAIVAMIYLY